MVEGGGGGGGPGTGTCAYKTEGGSSTRKQARKSECDPASDAPH